jgi:hypothetical protein
VLSNLRTTLKPLAGVTGDPIIEWTGTHYRIQAKRKPQLGWLTACSARKPTQERWVP